MDPSPGDPRGFVLAADDFGISPGVSRAILALLAQGRLSAAGAMTNCAAWPGHARELRAFAGTADLGLHLNLTSAAPLAPMRLVAPGGELPGLRAIVRAAAASAAARAEIAAEIARQLDAFEDRLGRPPDYLDGHRHVHVLPGVRGAVLDVLAKRYRPGSVYLRNPFDTPGAIVARGVAVGKALVIAGLSLGFARQARGRGIPVNASFAGVSPFDPARDFAADFRRYLMAPRERHLVMCHPGETDDADLTRLDKVTATRPLETRFLQSARCADICAELGMRPARFTAAS